MAMQLTDFRRLRNAVAALDVHYTRNRIAELRNLLLHRGMEFSSENTVITEEGIYHISPESGMATKVALYISEQVLNSKMVQMRVVDDNGYNEKEALDYFERYHLVRCNLLSHWELNRWPDKLRIAQRSDGGLYYRLLATFGTGKRKEEFHQDIENQRLQICNNCLIKINSMLSDATDKPVFTHDTFEPKLFFAAGFQATWRDRTKPAPPRGALRDIHPKDLEQISEKRKEQVRYICEGCNTELSSRTLRPYAHIHHSDHLSANVSFIRLQCLCIHCLAKEPDMDHVRYTEEYEEYLRVLRKPTQNGSET